MRESNFCSTSSPCVKIFIVFIPIGMILGSLFRVKGSWFVALMMGMIISVTIEALQFYFMRGFSEVDDVFYNTVGYLIGFEIIAILRIIFKTR